MVTSKQQEQQQNPSSSSTSSSSVSSLFGVLQATQQQQSIKNDKKNSSSTSLLLSSSKSNNNNNNNILEWSYRNSVATSRYSTDYDVIQLINHGAFGIVYQVTHKIDQCTYALKRIKLPPSVSPPVSSSSDDIGTENNTSTTDVILREVQMLSRIHHENVVRYYGAWIEYHDDTFITNDINRYSKKKSNKFGVDDESFIDDVDDFDSISYPTNSTTSNVSSTAAKSAAAAAVTDVENDTPICQLCNTHYIDWEVSLEQWGLLNTVLQPLNLCINCYQNSLPSNVVDITNIHIRPQRQMHQYLYILMEYCCDGTLMDEIYQCYNNNNNEHIDHDDMIIYEKIMSYFIQCIEGLEYLHMSGIIHRDIKPNNIFIANHIVKIGDLGLATTTKTNHKLSTTSDGNNNNDNQHHSSEHMIGTYLYAAPEVQSGIYTDKCDIYSMGVVLVEILSNFQTKMERAVVLEKLRSTGTIPNDFVTKYPPYITDLVRRMLHNDMSIRPSCREILDILQPHLKSMSTTTATIPSIATPKLEFPSDSNTQIDLLHSRISELESIVSNKEKTIQRLQQLLKDNNITF